MTEVDKVFQIAASRIQGLTRQVNHWKDRANELEAALGTEKAARISAEATRDRALNAGAANAELQEELQKERAEHQETRLMFNKGQAKLREQNAKILTINDVVDGIRVQLGLEEECDVNRALENFMGHCAANEKLFIGENQSALAHLEQALNDRDEAHAAIWGLGCEMANREEILRAEVAELREELDRIRRGLNCSKEEWEREEERSNKRQVVEDSLGIKSGDNIIEAIDRLKSSDWFDERNHLKYQVIPELEKQRDGLTTQVQDMRAEIERRFNEAQRLKAELTVVKDERDQLRVERDSLRSEVAALKSQTPKHPVKVGEYVKRLTGFNTTLAGEIGKVTRVDDDAAEIEYEVKRPNGETGVWCAKNCEPCDPPHTEPVPKRAHPVAVGGYLRRLTGFNTTPAGEVARVTLVDDDDPSQLEYEVVRPNGQKGRWSAKGCEPCDPSATHDTPEGRSVAESVIRDDRNTEPKPGDTVRLMRTPTHRDYPATWEGRWGLVGREAVVVNMSSRGASRLVGVTFADGRFLEWPVSCVEVVRTEPDEIKVGDLVEVFQATDANWTRADEIGIKGTVQRINMSGHMLPVVYLSNDGAYALRDVRKIRRGPKPGDKVRLVRKPTEQDYPMGWHDSWGEVGDTSMVYVLSSGRRAVRVSSGFEWPLSCIEFVDAK